MIYFIPKQTGIEKSMITFNEPCTCGCIEFHEISEEYSMNKEKLKEALDFARENNLSWIEVDGIKMEVPKAMLPPSTDADEKNLKSIYNPEPEYTEEEILYYATPYFDELQARKKLRQEQQKHDESLKD